MRIARVFAPSVSSPGTRYALPPDASRHLGKVLRARVGQSLVCFDGTGREYTCTITDIDRKQVWVQVESVTETSNESPLSIKLALAITRGDRMDFAIQKSVELGVVEILPFFSERCEVKLQGDKASKRTAHWQAVALSACEQSGRAVVPQVLAPQALADLVTTEHAMRLVLDPTSEQTLSALPITGNEVLVAIGPEGGFSNEEVDLMTGHGFDSVRLGPRVLRAETAAIVATAALQTLHGDLGR